MNVIYYIVFLLFFLIIYSACFKTVEGFDDEFYYYNKLIDYKTIPNSYVNDSTPSRTVNKFGFYKGKGTFKKGYTKETKSDEKISTLNKLLDKLLGSIVSENQDCIGEFGKYSECDKSCGSNAFQTRKYNIKQKRGKNGKDCPFTEGYEEKISCDLDECQLGDVCENNKDCESGNCDPNSRRCENMVPCNIENFHVCNENQCMQLNEEYDNNVMREGVYIYNNVDKECFFKTPAEIEELNLNIYTYDYRTISDQVKDVVLECDYFQVKKDDVGPCINRPNIVIDENRNPVCSPGFGPEPTIFNGPQACTKCLIPIGERSKNGCFCRKNTEWDKENNTCTNPESISQVGNLCTDRYDGNYYLKYKNADGDCEFCQSGTYFKKTGDISNCVPCSSDTNSDITSEIKTFSSNCNEKCIKNNYNSEYCLNMCGISGNNHKIPVDKISRYLQIEGEWDRTEGSLGGLDYQEKCIRISDPVTSFAAENSNIIECPEGQYLLSIEGEDNCECSNTLEYKNDEGLCNSCYPQEGCNDDGYDNYCITINDIYYKRCISPIGGHYVNDLGEAKECQSQKINDIKVCEVDNMDDACYRDGDDKFKKCRTATNGHYVDDGIVRRCWSQDYCSNHNTGVQCVGEDTNKLSCNSADSGYFVVDGVVRESGDCEYTDSGWTECFDADSGQAKLCDCTGEGDCKHSRTYTITQIPTGDGELCPGTTELAATDSAWTSDGSIEQPPFTRTETKSCENNACQHNCSGTWSEWSHCSKDCGGGIQTRTYTRGENIVLTDGREGGQNCDGQPDDGHQEQQPCPNPPPCPPENCVGQWELDIDYGDGDQDGCSERCRRQGKRGRRQYIYQVTHPAKYGGEDCPHAAGHPKLEDCNFNCCPGCYDCGCGGISNLGSVFTGWGTCGSIAAGWNAGDDDNNCCGDCFGTQGCDGASGCCDNSNCSSCRGGCDNPPSSFK